MPPSSILLKAFRLIKNIICDAKVRHDGENIIATLQRLSLASPWLA